MKSAPSLSELIPNTAKLSIATPGQHKEEVVENKIPKCSAP